MAFVVALEKLVVGQVLSSSSLRLAIGKVFYMGASRPKAPPIMNLGRTKIVNSLLA